MIKPVAYDDAQPVKYNGELYCFFENEMWIWRQGLYSWIALEQWPPALIVINDRIAVVDEETGEYSCCCPRYVLTASGCICGGN